MDKPASDNPPVKASSIALSKSTRPPISAIPNGPGTDKEIIGQFDIGANVGDAAAAAALRERDDRGWATLVERCYAGYANTKTTRTGSTGSALDDAKSLPETEKPLTTS